MIVFKNYLKIVFANRTFFIPLIILLAVATYFNVAMSEKNETPEINRFSYAIIDRDGSQAAQDVIQFMSDKAQLKPLKDGENSIKDALFHHQVDAVLVIPKGFAQDVAAGRGQIQKYSSPNSWAGFYVDMNLNNYLNTKALYEEKLPNLSHEQLTKILAEDLNSQTKVQYLDGQKEANRLDALGTYMNFVAYVLLMQILLSISITTAAFNEGRVNARIRGSSYSDAKFHRAMIGGHVLMTLIVMLFPILAAFAFFPADLLLSVNGLLMMFRIFCHALTILALAGVVSSLATDQEKISMIVNVIALPVCFLSGVFVPMELISQKILRFSQFLPEYWFVKGIHAVSQVAITPNDYSQYWQSIGIEMGMMLALALIALGINRQKRMLRW